MKPTALFLAAFLTAARCFAESPPWTYGAEADFNRQYVWQGVSYDRGFLMQPSAWISKNGFGLNYWGDDVIRNDNYRTKNDVSRPF